MIQELRAEDPEHRRKLEEEGCPLALPVILREGEPVPEEYQAITSYWEPNYIFPTGLGLIHGEQLRHWDDFQQVRRRDRDYYRRHPEKFGNLEKYSVTMREKYGVPGEFRLQMDEKQQTRLETWSEFQIFCLHHHDRLWKILRHNERKLEKQIKLAEENAQGVCRRTKYRVPRYHFPVSRWIELNHERIEKHKVLLDWVQKQRVKMELEQAASAEEDRNEGAGAARAA